jgi:hypothetical protein
MEDLSTRRFVPDTGGVCRLARVALDSVRIGSAPDGSKSIELFVDGTRSSVVLDPDSARHIAALLTGPHQTRSPPAD